MSSDASLPLEALDKLFEHRMRLAIAVLLRQHERINFARFKQVLDTTDGNLGAQLRKLEDAGYVVVDKQFEDRKPVSWYALTDQGREALKAHVAALQQLLKG